MVWRNTESGGPAMTETANSYRRFPLYTVAVFAPSTPADAQEGLVDSVGRGRMVRCLWTRVVIMWNSHREGCA